jgi:hypothetical protein
VELGRVLTDTQLAGEGSVGAPLPEQPKDLCLAVGQGVRQCNRSWVVPVEARRRRECRVNHRQADVYGMDRFD